MEDYQTIYVTVAVKIKNDCDPQEVIWNCDYNFIDDNIIDTEIVSMRGEPLI
jgi:hypothetical protein